MRFSHLFTGLCLFGLMSCSKFNAIRNSKDYSYKLDQANKLFDKKDYNDAEILYEDLYVVYKGTDKFEELYYKTAYCLFYLKEYQEAESYFAHYLEVYPNSLKAEEVDYMRGYSVYKLSPKVELEQTNTVKAMGMMQTFIDRHPGSDRIKDANAIIDECRAKLELKAYNAAKLYYKLSQFKAAAIGYEDLLTEYGSSASGDEYNLELMESYYQYAVLSIPEKQAERFEKVVSEYQDFSDRYPDSKLLTQAAQYRDLSQNNIKAINNEQAKTSIER
jgi:outer membrane protein assembly factor BamD